MFNPGDKVRRKEEFFGSGGWDDKNTGVYTIKTVDSNDEEISLVEIAGSWWDLFRFELVEEKKDRQKYYLVGWACYSTLEEAKKSSGGTFEIKEVELVAIHSPSVPEVIYTRKEV